MTQGVYWVYQPSQDRALYVGSSNDIERRLSEHRRQLQNGKHINPRLKHTYNKYGAADIHFLTLEETDNLIEREEFWMMAIDPVCNLAIAADNPMRGRTMSAVSREKIAASKRGVKRAPFSEEYRRKVSEAMQGNKRRLGLKHSEESKAQIGASQVGHKHTEATKAKIRAARAKQVPPTLGKKLPAASEERKLKIRDALMRNTNAKKKP